MANFQEILQKITTGAEIAATVQPAIAQWGSDHAAATQQIIQIAGAGVAALDSDPAAQSEAVASAQLASALVPLVFSFISLFRKPKPAA